MVRPKGSSKKMQKRGVDFKKYKNKLGRKLPPPKNATNTEIKSKAIILPEQSVASERVGLAVSKKGLTLKELLQQTSHHNAKARRDALIGIRDLATKYPSELKSHKLVMIEKLRERISDDDKVVRETLYQLFKSVIFPGCKEEIPGPIISLIMAYIFNAMTHMSFEIRLMAFKFFELVVQHYPSSFLLYAEKILENYEDILKKNHSYLQDKSKLKNALAGFVHCLSLLPSVDNDVNSLNGKNTDARGTLHAFELEISREHSDFSSIIDKLKGLMPVLVNCFQELIPSVLGKPQVDSLSFECMSCVLQSIDLALKYFIRRSNKCQTASEVLVSTVESPDVRPWGVTTLPILLKRLLEVFPLSTTHNPTDKTAEKDFVLNVAIAEIFLKFNEWIGGPVSVKVLEFVENALRGKICCDTRSSKAVREKTLVTLLTFIPQLVLRTEGSLKLRVLEAFTEAFKSCKPSSSLKLACLSAIEEMLLPSNRYTTQLLDTSCSEILPFQIEWIHELPVLLVQLGDKDPSSSKIILHLHLWLGQHVPIGSSLALEFDSIQDSFIEFYCTFEEERDGREGIHYGPFVLLPRDCQDIAVCSLYYFSIWDSRLLKSLIYCCLCHSLDPSVIFRIIEVLHSSYKAGHIEIAEQISFLVTLLARYGASPEKNGSETDYRTLKAITAAICSCLSEMGDNALVLQIIQKPILNEMSLNPPLSNKSAMLRTLASLDSRPTSLSDDIVIKLGNSILHYMLDSAHCVPDKIHDPTYCDEIRMCKYHLVPCFILLDNSDKLLHLVLNSMGSFVAENSQSLSIKAVATILLFMYKDAKMQRALSCCKEEIRKILRGITFYQDLNAKNLSLEERHKMQVVFNDLKTVTSRLHCWNADDLSNI